MLISDFFWVFIYVSGFGFSDIFVKNFIKSNGAQLIYYTILLTIGTLLLLYFHESQTDNS